MASEPYCNPEKYRHSGVYGSSRTYRVPLRSPPDASWFLPVRHAVYGYTYKLVDGIFLAQVVEFETVQRGMKSMVVTKV